MTCNACERTAQLNMNPPLCAVHLDEMRKQTSLADIVAALPDGYIAKVQYKELLGAYVLQQIRAGNFIKG